MINKEQIIIDIMKVGTTTTTATTNDYTLLTMTAKLQEFIVKDMRSNRC